MITIHGMRASGNCYKLQLLLAQLDQPYRWNEMDLFNGATRTPEFLAKNPNGKVPLLELEDGRCLPESNAILCYLAEGTPLLPSDSWQRAQVLQWLFYEQYSHEPYVAVARFQMVYLGKKLEEREARVVERAEKALDVLEEALSGRDYLVGDALTLADISLLAYTRLAHEGGFRLSHRPAVRKWIARCESDLNISSEQPAAFGGARHG